MDGSISTETVSAPALAASQERAVNAGVLGRKLLATAKERARFSRPYLDTDSFSVKPARIVS